MVRGITGHSQNSENRWITIVIYASVMINVLLTVESHVGRSFRLNNNPESNPTNYLSYINLETYR